MTAAPALQTRRVVYMVFPDAPAAMTGLVASSAADRAVGLQGVRQLARNWGLVLDYPERADQALWMRGVLVPLDMIFVDDGRIVGIVHSAEPGDETARSVGVASRLVIETAGGWCHLWGVLPGQRVTFEELRT